MWYKMWTNIINYFVEGLSKICGPRVQNDLITPLIKCIWNSSQVSKGCVIIWGFENQEEVCSFSNFFLILKSFSPPSLPPSPQESLISFTTAAGAKARRGREISTSYILLICSLSLSTPPPQLHIHTQCFISTGDRNRYKSILLFFCDCKIWGPFLFVVFPLCIAT